MKPHIALVLFFLRDFVLVLFSTVAVCSTMLISSVETLLRLMASRKHVVTTAPNDFDATAGLLIFYYVTLTFFLCVALFVLGNFLVRIVWEYTLVKHGRGIEKSGQYRVLRFCLWTAILLLAGLFVAYWAFWGKLLATLSWRMQVVISRLSEGSADGSTIPALAVKELGAAANRTFVVVVFFVLSISFNVLALMRQLINKTVLLKANSGASLFRVRHVDLAQVETSAAVHRQLWFSFAFDVAELWTLATWSLYPIFVAVFWVEESSCIGSGLGISVASLSPLIECMFVARYHLLIVCVGWLGVVFATAAMYFLRVLDERRFLAGSDKSRWWHMGPFVLVMCVLFWAGLAATILSAIMMGKPLLSSSEDRIYLAAPGVVLFCGNVLLLFHVGRKLAAALGSRRLPKTSFFFERGVPLTDTPLLRTGEDDQAYELEIPYVKAADEILY